MHLTCKSKKLTAVFLSIMILLSVSVPFMAANAAVGSLGTETPEVYAAFATDTEADVDGNSLTSGDYKVTFHLKGMENLSLFQLSGTYSSAITVNSYESLITANYGTIKEPGAQSFSFSKFMIGYFSNTDSTTAINAQDTAIITINITVNSDTAIDFEQEFIIDESPFLTFIQSDHRDEPTDCYALVDSYEGYTGNLYKMTADLSPLKAPESFTVTGTMLQMTSMSGDMGAPAPGLTVTIGGLTAVTAADGTFTIEGVPMDAAELTISGESTIDRTIIISSDNAADGILNLGDKAIICCDYSKNGSINPIDLGLFNDTVASTASSNNYNVYADFNGDGSINPRDSSVFMNFVNKPMADIYNGITN